VLFSVWERGIEGMLGDLGQGDGEDGWSGTGVSRVKEWMDGLERLAQQYRLESGDRNSATRRSPSVVSPVLLRLSPCIARSSETPPLTCSSPTLV
jgi:hypothetical protein